VFCIGIACISGFGLQGEEVMSQIHDALSSLSEKMEYTKLNRRQMLKSSAALGLSVPALAALLAACEDDDTTDDDVDAPAATDDDDPVDDEDPDDTDVDVDDDDDDDEPVDDTDDDVATEGEGQYGGSANFAIVAEPPTIDVHQTTQIVVSLVGWHMMEPLFTWDGEFNLVNELAETHEVSDDGMINTIELRSGVTFHNGEDLTANDVIASIERWGEISSGGGTLVSNVEEMEQVDDLTIDFHMTQAFGAFAPLLARLNQGCAIYPASVLEEAGTDPINQPVGTGPYKLVEYVPDQHIHVERFEDYNSREEEASGYSGHKAQYLDDIYFIPVPDEATQISGLQAGDFDILESISTDYYNLVDDDPDLVAEDQAPEGWISLVLNMAEGPMADQTMRQAVQAAIDVEPILDASFGSGFYRIDPGLMLAETVWHSTVSEEYYNRADPERAAELLEEAGYDGEPIIFMSTNELHHHYNTAIVAEQQLSDAGFNIDLQIYDWATVGDRSSDPENWHIRNTTILFTIDPALFSFIPGTTWPGWWATDRKVELAGQLLAETDFDTRFEIWEELQELFYEEVPVIKLGDRIRFSPYSNRLQGLDLLTQLGVPMWNTWVED
jgi:peptide/nickel transport system substrate-binding protein